MAAYLKVIRQECSDAVHILDRFQNVAKMNQALHNVRGEESRRMKREQKFRRPNSAFVLRELLRYLKTDRAYLLKEAFW